MTPTEIIIIILAFLSVLSYIAGRLDERRLAKTELDIYKEKVAKLNSIINQLQKKIDVARLECDHILEYLDSKGEIKQ